MAKSNIPDPSPFVKALTGDGTTPPDVRVLTGWLGISGEEGYIRLYLDPELSTYVDIPRDAVLYVDEVPDSRPPGAVNVWVRRDADLKEGGSAIERASRFLFGQVQQDFQAGGGAQSARAIPNTHLCLTFARGCEVTGFTGQCPSLCPDTRVVCPSWVDACPTRLGCGGIDVQQQQQAQQVGGPITQLCPQTQFCPRLTVACPTRICHTLVGCPTFGRCPSAVDACPSSLGCTFACNVDVTVFQQTPVLQQPRNFAFDQQQQFGGPQTQLCPRPTLFNCVTRFCNTLIGCPTFGRCPSAVDACPSSLGCTFACNVDFTIFQQTPVLQRQPQNFAFDQQQQFGGPQTWICPRPTLVNCPTRFCHTLIGCPTFGHCPSAVDACPSSLGCTFACNVDFTIFQQTPVLRQPQNFAFDQQQFQQFGDTGPFTSRGPACHHVPTIVGCQTSGRCPSAVDACPTRFGCDFGPFTQDPKCLGTSFGCPTSGACPSAVDACPSSLGCTFACNVDFTIFQQTPVLQRQPQNFAFDQQQFQQFGDVGPFTSKGPACMPVTVDGCQTFAICPSAVDACPSQRGCTFTGCQITPQQPVLQHPHVGIHLTHYQWCPTRWLRCT